MKKGVNWTPEETKEFLSICTARRIIDIMDGKQARHIEIFRSFEEEMARKNFFKTAEQMKLKLKNLKLAYYKCKRSNETSGASRNTCPYYEELDLLYGCRPYAEALDSSSGVDTADPLPTEDHSANDNMDLTSDLPEDFVQDSSSEPTASANKLPKRKRSRNFAGRNSYQAMLDSYNQKWLESQEQVLRNILEIQNKQQEDMLHKELESQRKWEAEVPSKEQQFQREQTAMMMQTFMQCMQGLRSPNPPPTRKVNIIPTNRPATTTSATLFTPNQTEIPGTLSETTISTPTATITNPRNLPCPILGRMTPTVMTGENSLKRIKLIGTPYLLNTIPATRNLISNGTTTPITPEINGGPRLSKTITLVGNSQSYAPNSDDTSLV